MCLSRHCVFVAITAITFVGPCVAQDAIQTGQTASAVSGSGNAGRIAVWKNSTTLGSSVLVQSSGNVGIGTTTPAAKLDVTGDINLTGSTRFQGSTVLQVPGGLSSNNIALGNAAMQNNTTGIDNTAIGTFALTINTTGFYNTASGMNALFANKTGTYNTANGANALLSNQIGSYNTAIGTGAMQQSLGDSNTAIGTAALQFNTTGNNNIAIGYFAAENVSGDNSNNIHIGNIGAEADNGTIRFGTPGTQTSAFIAGIYGMTTGLPGVPVMVDSNGQLGAVSSSRRYKQDIQDMGDSTTGLMRLRPVTFRYKKPFDDGSKPIQYGLIAEEVSQVYPDLVARSADGQIETVKYQLLDSMLLNELQKQNTTIAAQKEQIRSLDERLARIEAALSGTTVTAAAQ